MEKQLMKLFKNFILQRMNAQLYSLSYACASSNHKGGSKENGFLSLKAHVDAGEADATQAIQSPIDLKKMPQA